MPMLTNFEFNKLEDLFEQQLEDIYDAEVRLTTALPKMAQAAKSPQLQHAFQEHLVETERHVQRLESIFNEIGKKPKRETCQAMKGLITEGDHMVKANGDAEVKDAGLIAAAQRVEHYEIASYGTLRNFAKRLGLHQAAETLQQTLDEEGAADHKLTEIAESAVNTRAATA